MTMCTIIKTFPWSADGVTTRHARAGDEVDLPDGLVAGLVRFGYVAVAALDKATIVPENKAMVAPENKRRGRPRKAD